MVRAKGPGPSAAMKLVCDLTQRVWGMQVQVLCNCRSKDTAVLCEGARMRDSVTTMDVSVHVRALGLPLGLPTQIPLDHSGS